VYRNANPLRAVPTVTTRSKVLLFVLAKNGWKLLWTSILSSLQSTLSFYSHAYREVLNDRELAYFDPQRTNLIDKSENQLKTLKYGTTITR
jgi:hypothetical protein